MAAIVQTTFSDLSIFLKENLFILNKISLEFDHKDPTVSTG